MSRRGARRGPHAGSGMRARRGSRAGEREGSWGAGAGRAALGVSRSGLLGVGGCVPRVGEGGGGKQGKSEPGGMSLVVGSGRIGRPPWGPADLQPDLGRAPRARPERESDPAPAGAQELPVSHSCEPLAW